MTGVSRAGAERIIASLNPEQREVATTLLGPVRVLAGAGTGKTTAITHRIAYGIESGVYDPKAVMALTFTTRAAAEMRSRLRGLGVPTVAARTFHSAALAQLRYFWPQVFGGRMPALIDSKISPLREAAGREGVDLDMATARDLASAIEWRKVRNLSIDDYATSDRPTPSGISPEVVHTIMRNYENIKLERRVIDFEDVLLATLGVLVNEPTIAAQVHAVYRVFVVDEYQDVSPVQQQLLDAWLGKRRDVCVVGDVAQTIYSFAGADARYLIDFDKTYPGAAHIEMVRNYRSTAAIVDAANTVMSGQVGAVVLTATTSGPRPAFAEFDNDEDEAAWIAAAIAERISGGETADGIAVLARLTSQLATIEAALGAAGIPYRLRNAAPYFARPEIQKAMLLLSVQAAKSQTIAARAASSRSAAAHPPASSSPIGVRASTAGSAKARTTDAELNRPVLHEVVDVLRELGFTTKPPEQPGAKRDEWEAMSAFLRMAEAMPDGSTLADFVAEMTARRTSQAEPAIQAVTVSTIHAAKGLEWDTVFVAGVADGILPLSYATDVEAVREERRLFYVAVTRARTRLAVSWASRDLAGRRRNPSPFLDGLSH